MIRLSYPHFFPIFIMWNRLFSKTSLFSFPSRWIKYNCRVNGLYNMKLANQSVNNHYLFILLLKSSCSGRHHRNRKSAKFPSHPMERSLVCPHYAIHPQVESRKSFCFVLSHWGFSDLDVSGDIVLCQKRRFQQHRFLSRFLERETFCPFRECLCTSLGKGWSLILKVQDEISSHTNKPQSLN